jgi:predicted metal-dependent HD superfamily phosphohydrolase
VPTGHDAQLLFAFDLSILGAEASRFDEYERQVRDEYRHVPGLLFRGKRRSVLQGFLARERIFNTDSFHTLLETRARGNLQRSIAQLGG